MNGPQNLPALPYCRLEAVCLLCGENVNGTSDEFFGHLKKCFCERFEKHLAFELYGKVCIFKNCECKTKFKSNQDKYATHLYGHSKAAGLTQYYLNYHCSKCGRKYISRDAFRRNVAKCGSKQRPQRLLKPPKNNSLILCKTKQDIELHMEIKLTQFDGYHLVESIDKYGIFCLKFACDLCGEEWHVEKDCQNHVQKNKCENQGKTTKNKNKNKNKRNNKIQQTKKENEKDSIDTIEHSNNLSGYLCDCGNEFAFGIVSQFYNLNQYQSIKCSNINCHCIINVHQSVYHCNNGFDLCVNCINIKNKNCKTQKNKNGSHDNLNISINHGIDVSDETDEPASKKRRISSQHDNENNKKINDVNKSDSPSSLATIKTKKTKNAKQEKDWSNEMEFEITQNKTDRNEDNNNSDVPPINLSTKQDNRKFLAKRKRKTNISNSKKNKQLVIPLESQRPIAVTPDKNVFDNNSNNSGTSSINNFNNFGNFGNFGNFDMRNNNQNKNHVWKGKKHNINVDGNFSVTNVENTFDPAHGSLTNRFGVDEVENGLGFEYNANEMKLGGGQATSKNKNKDKDSDKDKSNEKAARVAEHENQDIDIGDVASSMDESKLFCTPDMGENNNRLCFILNENENENETEDVAIGTINLLASRGRGRPYLSTLGKNSSNTKCNLFLFGNNKSDMSHCNCDQTNKEISGAKTRVKMNSVNTIKENNRENGINKLLYDRINSDDSMNNSCTNTVDAYGTINKLDVNYDYVVKNNDKSSNIARRDMANSNPEKMNYLNVDDEVFNSNLNDSGQCNVSPMIDHIRDTSINVNNITDKNEKLCANTTIASLTTDDSCSKSKLDNTLKDHNQNDKTQYNNYNINMTRDGIENASTNETNNKFSQTREDRSLR